MEDLIFELIKWADIVDHLPDKMGWIVVDAQMVTVQDPEYLSPDGRCCHQVLSSRPLVLAEKHRAVFDGNLHVTFLSQFYDRRPDLFYQFQVFLYIFGLVPSDKCGDHAHT